MILTLTIIEGYTMPNSNKSVISTITEFVHDAVDKADKFLTRHSMDELTDGLTVSPLHIIDEDIIDLDWINKVNDMVLRAFVIQYSNAVPMLTKDEFTLSLMDSLSQLNPDQTKAAEALKTQRNRLQRDRAPLIGAGALSIKVSDNKELPQYTKELIIKKEASTVKGKSNGYTPAKDIAVPAAQIKVQITLSNLPESSHVVLGILSSSPDGAFTGGRMGFLEDFFAWKDGAQSLSDLLLQTKLVEKRKKLIKADKNGTYAKILDRQAAAVTRQVMSKEDINVYGQATNMFTISSTTARKLENELHGKLSNKRVRAKLFENTPTMMLTIVDPDNEMITIYYRNGAETVLTKREAFKSSDNNQLTKALSDIANGMSVRF